MFYFRKWWKRAEKKREAIESLALKSLSEELPVYLTAHLLAYCPGMQVNVSAPTEGV